MRGLALRRLRRAGPAYAALLGVCTFWLTVLRGERLVVANLNDSAVHNQLIRFAGRQLSDGNWPMASWYPLLGLGSPYLQRYQSGPAVLTSVVGQAVGDDVAFSWSLYLLLALWPVAVYTSARIFELSQLTAVCAAAVAPVLVSASGYGYEHGSYTWQGYGLWPQAVGMWLLPLAWSLSFLAVTTGRRLVPAGIVLAASVSFHFLTGYQALLAVGLWVLVAGRGLWPRVGRAALLGTAAVLMSAWAVIPALTDAKYNSTSVYMVDSFYSASYGARQILTWLVQGDVYDNGRTPVVTGLVAVGLLLSMWRWRTSPASRALVSVWTFSLLLWFGPATWEGAAALFPGSESLLFHRFNMGVHLAGILLAGVGGAALLQLTFRLVTSAASRAPSALRAPVATTVCAVAALVVLLPAYHQVGDYDRRGTAQIEAQRLADAVDGADVRRLITTAEQSGPGRMYAGSRNNWGIDYRVGQVPVYAVLAAQDIDAAGFTLRASSTSADVDASFNAFDPEQLRLLGLRFLIYPETQAPPAGARLLQVAGRHRLYELSGVPGLLAVGDLVSQGETDGERVLEQAAPYLASGASKAQQYVSLSYDGDPALPVTDPSPPAVSPGTVLAEADQGEQGRYTGQVELNRRAAVILKSSYDGGWTALVDGEPSPVSMVSPSFVATIVPAGRHSVEFVYVPYDRHELHLGIGAATLLGLAVLDRRLRRRRRPAEAQPGELPGITDREPVGVLTHEDERASQPSS